MKIKIDQTKEKNTICKNSKYSSLNSSMIKIKRQQTKHTKASTNATIHSIHINTNKKSHNSKKSDLQNQQKKQKTIRNTELVTSGRTKQFKQKIKNKKSCDFQFNKKYNLDQEGTISYRQYCLVQNSFVPIVSKNQQRKLQDIMRSTADTTHRFEDFNRTTFRNIFPFKLKDNNQSISEISQVQENIFKKKAKIISKRQAEINASPFYEEIGIQYSERPQFIKPIQIKQQKKAVQIDIQTDQLDIQIDQIKLQQNEIVNKQSPVKNLDDLIKSQQQESLQNLLLKIQFKHLPNEKAFENLSRNEKDHYSQLLNSLIAKLNCSPRQKQQSQPHYKTKQMIEIQQINIIPQLEQIKLKFKKLEMEILKRESYQMNWIVHHKKTKTKYQFDTSMLAVTSFLLNFFCFIELYYLQQFLYSIKKLYGYSYSSQYLRITRKLKLQYPKYQVIDQQVFEQYCNQSQQINQLQKIHLKSIFDYINTLLDTYRPSYKTRGQPFPWSFKKTTSICQYVIDQNSFQIIFTQIKQKFEESTSILCGLLVDEQLCEDMSEINPLSLKRTQRQKLLVDNWLKQDNNDSRDLQSKATELLYELGQQVYNMLLLEIYNQKPFNSFF